MKNLKSCTQNYSPKNKSAVAFFFLFFLHGTSIGTRQQGISYNVLWLCVRFFALPECSNLAQCLKAKTDAKPLLAVRCG